MNKKIKTGLLSLLFLVVGTGSALASYLVCEWLDKTTVEESIVVEVTHLKLPDPAYPNQEICGDVQVHNVGSETQDVLIKGDLSSNLESVGITSDGGSTWHLYGEDIYETIESGKSVGYETCVSVKSDAAPGEAWTKFRVWRQ